MVERNNSRCVTTNGMAREVLKVHSGAEFLTSGDTECTHWRQDMPSCRLTMADRPSMVA